MKILLDENLPAKLKLNFGTDNKVFTVRDMGWAGKKNGELLGLMIPKGFDAFITIDKNLKHQQNLTKLPLTIFILSVKDNKHQTIQPLIDKVKKHLKLDLKAGVIEIK